LKISRLIAVAVIIAILVLSAFYVYLQSNPETTYKTEVQISQYTTEYPTNSNSTEPNAIAVDSQDNVWFTMQNRSALAELIPVPDHEGTTTWGIAVDNARGLVWFTEETTNSVWSFNIATHKFTGFKLMNGNSFPFELTIDNQGNVWFTEFFSNEIGEITAAGKLIEIPIPLSGTLEPSSITTDSTGKVWFTLPGVNSTGSYFDGQFQFQNLNGLAMLPVGIAIDSQGNIWLTQHGPSFISEFNPTTHYFETISTTVPSRLGTSLPYFSYVDQAGDVWFNEHYGNAEAEFIPSNNTLIEYFIPTVVKYAGGINGMLTSTVTPSGQPWYTEFFAGKVGTINTNATLGLKLNLLNYTGPITLNTNGTTALKFQVGGSLASQATIQESVGNLSSSFTYGLQGQTLMIHNAGSKPGVYFLTITALTTTLAVSQIIELEVE
jgi:streptogramin lyase